ncbi:DUF2726 domain-containing protein [Parendozoicomonas haliclonae]|uniref:DUF2726 domain-containing protein n=1 Tax=Parendozoicomonas haliclonae TaxID=1960125 RepID=UPI0010557F95|nr:DUF2726 domain-containing protein [Parendozoicomonas haliclonae]
MGINLGTGPIPVYFYPLAMLAGVGIIAGIIYWLLRRRAASSLYLKDPLFDGPSRSFYGLLDVAAREHFSLFRNVPVDTVICHSGAVSPLPGKVRNASFDILLCDRRKMLPKCAIKLVEKKRQNKQMDELRDYCDRVDLPLLVYEVRGILDVARLRRDVYQAAGMHELLGTCEVVGGARDTMAAANSDVINESRAINDAPILDDTERREPTLSAEHDEADHVEHDAHEEHHDGGQTCRKCGAAMMMRTVSSGKHAGRKALVCETFPTCRYAVLSKEEAS